MSAVEQLEHQGVVPVLRCGSAADAVATARAAARGGLDLVELTFTTPGVLDAVRTLAGDGLTVAVGTVTTADQVRAVAAAGATIVVSFANPAGLIQTAAAAGIAAIPGALTPSEILAAYDAGAAAVKLFPARLAGPSMIADMRAVLPGLRLIPTGGVNLAEVADWLEAGALAVGLGSSLGTAGTIGAQSVTQRCRELRRVVASVSGSR